MQLYKISTAAALIVGPILDSTGAEYTGAVIGDISLSKNGGTLTALASTATLVHIANGQYTLTLRTTDLDTAGRFDIYCNKSTYQMPPVRGTVLPATTFDAIVTNTAGAANGLLIAGSNAATTFAGLTTGALACTTITASGAVAFQSTFAVTTSTSLAALSCTTLTASGAVAFQSTFAVTTSTSLAALSATTVTFSGAVAFQSTFAVTTSTSLAALSCTTLTASGAVAFQSTFGVTGTTSLAAVTTSGTVTCNALTVTNATTLSGAVSLGSTLGVTGTTTLAAVNTGAIGTGNVTITGTLSTSGTTTFNALTVTNATTLSGAVSMGSTFGVTGTVTFNAFTITNALTVSGATTLTGAVTASNASNNIVGIDVAKISGDATAADNLELFFDGTGYNASTSTVGTVTTVTNQLTAAAIATGVWQDATAGDFTAASSIGKSLYTAGVVPGGSGGLFISGSNSGTTTFGALTVSGTTTLAAVNTGAVTMAGGLSTGLTITSTGGAAVKISTSSAVAAAVTLTSVAAATLTLTGNGTYGAIWADLDGKVLGNGTGTIAAVGVWAMDGSGNAIAPAATFTGITSLAQWLGLLAGKQTGNTTARTELQATGAGSGTFDETTDSVEAIRDRGDAAWGASGGLTVQDIVNGVWDELGTDHTDAGSMGDLLGTAGAAADPLLNSVPGTYASGTAGYALGRIGAGQITTTSIVAQSGDVEIVAGDDYANADGRAIDWTDTDASWPTLTAATIAVHIILGNHIVLNVAGSVVTATGANKKVRVELTAAQTATLGAGEYVFAVVATLTGGHVDTLLRGLWTVRSP